MAVTRKKRLVAYIMIGGEDMSSDGEQWVGPDGTIHTVNSTEDPRVPGGYYHTQYDPETGAKATAVYNADGTFADVPANKAWVEKPTN